MALPGSRPRIELHPFRKADIDLLISWIPSPEFLLQWAGPLYSYPLDRGQLERHLEHAAGTPSTHILFKALTTDTGQVVGHGEIAGIDRANRSAYLARVLVGPADQRGKG